MRHPMSGAGSIKDDGHDDDYVYEIKDANKSFTLNAKDLSDMHTRAARQTRQARYIVKFANGITAEITIKKERV